jgi:Copper type II ascorbate-dependent monooxygenase, C-terminal domain
MEAVAVRVTQAVGRLGGLAAGMTAALAIAACGNGSAGSAEPAGVQNSPASTHAGHGSTAVPAAAALRDGERFVTLAMPQPYTPTAPHGGTDEYRCFLVDPKLTSMAYLTGSQFLPQNTAIVHHAIFFRVDPADAAKARGVDAASSGEGWTCFGDAGIGGDAGWVAHWAPGANETLLSPGVGYPMPPGSLLVMQVHYNLLATGGKPGGTDQSSIRLRLTDGTKKLDPLETATLPAPVELPCAAGESGPLCDRTAAVADVTRRFGDDVGSTEAELVQTCDHGAPVAGTTQHCDHPVRQAGTIYAVAGHMHLLGRSIKIELNPGTPDARTLLDIPVYNFDDQAIHPLNAPLAVKPGNTLRVTCTHDAGLRKLLPQLRTLPPRYVVWGDGTSDEMCLGLVIWSPKG